MISSKYETETNNFYLSSLEYINGIGLLQQKSLNERNRSDGSHHYHHLALLPFLASSTSFMNSSVVPRFIMRTTGRISSLDRPDFEALVCKLLFDHSSTLQFAQSYNFCNYRFTNELHEFLVKLAQKFPYAHKSLRKLGSYSIEADFLADLVKHKYSDYMTDLRLASTPNVKAEGMKLLESFSNLRALRLSNVSDLTNESIVSALNSLAPHLEHLDIWSLKDFTASGFLRLEPMPNLHTLSFDNQKYLFITSDENLNPFMNFSDQFPNLTSLDIAVCAITDEALGCACPANGPSHLRQLRIYQNDESVTDLGFEKFFSSSTQFSITNLDISYNRSITDRTISGIVPRVSRTLTNLNIRCTDGATDDAIAVVSKNLPCLEILNISSCNKLTFETLRHLTNAETSLVRNTLKTLNIRGCFLIFCPEDNPAYRPDLHETAERVQRGDEDFVQEFAAIATLPKLEHLTFAALGLNLPKLKVLNEFNGKVLRVLNLADFTMMRDEYLDFLEDVLISKKHVVVTEKIDMSGCWKLSKGRVDAFKNALRNAGGDLQWVEVTSDHY